MNNLPADGDDQPGSVEHRTFKLTPGRPMSLRRLRSMLQTPIPGGCRTAVLAFLIGAILSFPTGMLLALTVRRSGPPDWIEPWYLGVVMSSFVLLPIWSHFAFRREPLLRSLGLGFFKIALLLFVIGQLFPAL